MIAFALVCIREIRYDWFALRGASKLEIFLRFSVEEKSLTSLKSRA